MNWLFGAGQFHLAAVGVDVGGGGSYNAAEEMSSSTVSGKVYVERDASGAPLGFHSAGLDYYYVLDNEGSVVAVYRFKTHRTVSDLGVHRIGYAAR